MISKSILKTLELLGNSLKKSLNQSEEEYLDGIADRSGTLEQLLPFRNWDWTQGVALCAFWRLYQLTGKKQYFEVITAYYDGYLESGLPGKNINSICPMLTMAFLWEHSKDDRYKPYIIEWASWIMERLPRTDEGCFQHITAEYDNYQEIWADTVFMALQFLAKAGLLLDKIEYVREAEYQFLVHIKYLTDRKTGLFYHGWTFSEKHHFAGALWCRGNCWLTMGIPLFLSMAEPSMAVRNFLVKSLENQVKALEAVQADSGLWHTLLNHADSYCEVSGSAGIGAGIMMACRRGLIPRSCQDAALRAFESLAENIGEEGEVSNVSIGTPMGRKDLIFYKEIKRSPMPYGQALMMLYLIEILEIQ